MFLTLLLSIATTPPPALCSLVPSLRPKRHAAPYLLGRALSDTVPAGAGTVLPSQAPGHFGRPSQSPAYGQLVQVTRIGGSAIPRSIQATKQVIVVPWDYDSGCQPSPWPRTSRWIQTGRTIFLHPVLRPQSAWYRGIPTFDAFAPQFDVYPSRFPDPVFGSTDISTRPEDVFAVYEHMPDGEHVDSVGLPALASFRRWAASRPHLMSRWPAQSLIQGLVGAAIEADARRLPLPMRGTYRVEVHLPNLPVRIYYARTADLASGSVLRLGNRDSTADPSPWSTAQYKGVELWTMMARTVDSLPTHWDAATRADQPWHIAWPPRTPGEAWMGEIDPWIFFPTNPRDAASDSAYAIIEQWFNAAWDTNTVPEFMGSFVRRSDGHYDFHEALDFGAHGSLVIDAIWLSSVTIPREY